MAKKKLSKMLSKYVDGGKPIGSTGLFGNGGKSSDGDRHKYYLVGFEKESDRKDKSKIKRTDKESLNWDEAEKKQDEMIESGKYNSVGIFAVKDNREVSITFYKDGGKPIGSTGLFENGGGPNVGKFKIFRIFPGLDAFGIKVGQMVYIPYLDIIAETKEKAVEYAKEIIPDLNEEYSENQVSSIEEISNFSSGGKPIGSTGLFAKGGKIKNQYSDKSSEEVWNGWSNKQRKHFIDDHDEELISMSISSDISKKISASVDKKWNKIPEQLKDVVKDHVSRGQYASGGKPIGSTGLFADGGALDFNNKSAYDDYILAHDVELFAENDGDLYRQRYVPIIKNLKKKKDKGTFDEQLAAKLWKYYWEDADKRYQKQIMDKQPKGYVLSVKDRNLLSAKMAHWVGSVANDNDLTFESGGSVDGDNIDQLFSDITDYGETAIDEFVGENSGFGYENYDERRTGEVEHMPESGFIPFTNGGVNAIWFEYGAHLVGSGSKLPTDTLQKELNRQNDLANQSAIDRFKEEYPSIVEKIGEDKINYSDLYEEGFGSEAEQLSEWENEWMMEETIMFRLGFYLYKPTNSRSIDRKPTCYVFGLVNMEAPYHREGNMEDFVEDEFTFHNLEGFKKKLSKSLETIKAWFNGGSYNQGRELVIRRMAMGGPIDLSDKMIRIVNPMTTDNTLGAHAGSPITSQDAV